MGTFNRWIKPCVLSALDVAGRSATIDVPDQNAKEWLEFRQDVNVRRALAGAVDIPPDDLQITYQIAEWEWIYEHAPDDEDPPPEGAARITITVPDSTPALARPGRRRLKQRMEG